MLTKNLTLDVGVVPIARERAPFRYARVTMGLRGVPPDLPGAGKFSNFWWTGFRSSVMSMKNIHIQYESHLINETS